MHSGEFRHADIALGGFRGDDLGEDAQSVVVEVEDVAAELRERGEFRRSGPFVFLLFAVAAFGDG